MPYKPDLVGGPANEESVPDKGIELNASNKDGMTGKTPVDPNKFASTDDKRTKNFPIWPIEQYVGDDDVALKYKTLTDEEKENMMRVKMAAQHLINTLRSLGSNSDIDKAIQDTQSASMFGVRFITQSNKS